STMNVNIIGSQRNQDADNVSLFANGVVNSRSTLNFTANLGAGNSSFKGVFDANTFRIANDGGAATGGGANFTVLGRRRNDSISFKSINANHPIELSGQFGINILSGPGKDNIKVDFAGMGFTDGDRTGLLATNRALRLRVDGDDGDDTITVDLTNTPAATFDYDVGIVGGSRNSHITFIGVNAGGRPTFGPAGSVFLDGN